MLRLLEQAPGDLALDPASLSLLGSQVVLVLGLSFLAVVLALEQISFTEDVEEIHQSVSLVCLICLLLTCHLICVLEPTGSICIMWDFKLTDLLLVGVHLLSDSRHRCCLTAVVKHH